MERLGDILKRSIATSTSKADTDTSSSAESPGSEERTSFQPECSICNGAGFVYADVPPEHPDYGRAVPCECSKREFERERLSRLQRYSNLGSLTRLTFDNLMSRGRSSDPANQERFYQCCAIAKAFAEKPEGWLVLMGPSGCGKTHLAAAIANHCLKLGYAVSFHVVPDLLDHFRATFGPNSAISYDELFEHVRNTPLLVLDDLGTQSSTSWAREKLYQIINHRFNEHLPMLVTTNVPLEDLDERLQTRLTEPSLSQVCVVEERKPPIFQQVGSLGAELLSKMTFESFDTRGLNANDEQQRNLELAFRTARRFAESPEGWLVLLGGYGCGKTHLAAAISNYRLRKAEPVFFIVVPDLLDHLRSTFSPDSVVTYDELFERVRSTPLLILDDLGTQTASPWAREKLYQIINHRYNGRLPTVITSSNSLDEIEDRLSSRMGDLRLSTVINVIAPDYRGGMPKMEEEPKSPVRRGRRSR